MPKSEVMNQILNSFVAARPGHVPEDKELLNAFCDYAASWLATNGVIGLGHTSSGMSLRFIDGTEKVLFALSSADDGTATPPVNISGNSGSGITRTAADTHPSVAITGR
jgi:hypothetical protein